MSSSDLYGTQQEAARLFAEGYSILDEVTNTEEDINRILFFKGAVVQSIPLDDYDEKVELALRQRLQIDPSIDIEDVLNTLVHLTQEGDAEDLGEDPEEVNFSREEYESGMALMFPDGEPDEFDEIWNRD